MNTVPRLDPAKFQDPLLTADGQTRAQVIPTHLETLWLNTGTLCNLTCANCYIESSPSNDKLVWLTLDDAIPYLDEIAANHLGTTEIGFTGGEPFMNPQIDGLLKEVLQRGFRALVLTNAMTPLRHHRDALLQLNERYGGHLTLRVSVDHYSPARHEEERGAGSWAPMLDGLRWLAANGFVLSVAGRTFVDEDETAIRAGFADLFASESIALEAHDPTQLILFPEMDPRVDVPEVTTACWDLLGVNPADMMCATSRMVIKRKGRDRASVVACTLLPDDPQFELGRTLTEALQPIPLNHPHCAKFCVLGGGSCSA